MALFGVRVEYSSDEKPYSFRFYSIAADLTGALDNGEEAWSIVETIMGNDIICDNIHAWVRNVSPNQFDNRAMNDPGGIAVDNPIKPEITTRVFFSAQNSYPYYWDLRARLDGASLIGTGFNGAYQTLLTSATIALQTMVGADKIVKSDGDSLSTVSIPNEYFIRQLSKRHYNRTPSGS